MVSAGTPRSVGNAFTIARHAGEHGDRGAVWRLSEDDRDLAPTSSASQHTTTSDRTTVVRAPWQLGRERAHAAPSPLRPRSVPLAAAAGLTLAEDLRTLSALPAFDTAAMDSYAVSGPGPHRVVGSVLAGTVSPGCLCAGEAVEIATGACVPPSADAVVALEEVDRYGTMLASPQPRSGQHIPGVSLVPAGTAIGPALLGLAASCGHDTLLVRPGPWVRIVLTGDELRHVGPSGDGQVRHALDPMLPALITGLGGEVEQIRWVNDQPAAALTDAIDDPTGDPSVVVVTGSTSVGMTDRLHALLRERGARWVVDGVACRPGHPQLLAELGHNVWVVGLPGNPFAALVAAHTLLAAVIAALCGRPL